MNPEHRSLHQIIETTVELAAANASEKGLGLICRLSPACRSAVGFDAWSITQILTNLLSNALRYTSEGAVTVEADCQTDDNGTHFEISVSDTGPGISPTIQTAMFALPDQREMLPGADEIGYGLIIARQLCEMFEGTLNINSQTGVGTTAVISGTLKDGEQSPIDNASLTDVFRNTYALIIDSDIAARRLLEAHLRSWGLQVRSVLDTGSALELVAETRLAGYRVSMLFASHELPEQDMVQLVNALRAHEEHVDTMLVITGSDITTARMSIRNPRIGDATLAMPVQPSALFDCITKHPYIAANKKIDSEDVDTSIPSVGTPSVLLVEDNIVNQCVATEILKRIGVSVTVANNGVEALSSLAQQRHDFVFMDCQMPEMDGFEATQAIREQPALADLPVVALTANALSGDRQRCLDAGMSDYLTKPFTKVQLESMLCKWLGENRIRILKEKPPGDRTSSSNEPQKSLVDEQALNEIRRLDSDGESVIFDEIINEYLVSSANLVAEIDSAVSDKSASEVGRHAHALKSSSAALGLHEFSAHCARLESFGQQQQMTEIEELWHVSKDIYQQSLNALRSAKSKKVA